MEFMDCLTGRRSVRAYTEEGVDRAVIERIVSAAAYAPSWKNSQTARYIAVTDAALKARIAENCVMGHPGNASIIRSAPVLIIVTTVSARSGHEKDGTFSTSKGLHWESFDAGLASEAFCLSAYAEGLGTVIMGIFDEAAVIETADVPEGRKVSALIALGHPAVSPTAPKRRELDELLSYR